MSAATQDILHAIRGIMRGLDLHSRKMMKRTGLTGPQFVVLRTLAMGGPLPANQLAKQVNLSQATVTSIADRLEKVGLITRTRTDRDRRVVTVAISPTGREKIDGIPEFFEDHFLDEFKKLAPWEQTLMISSLQRLSHMLGSAAEKGLAGSGEQEGLGEDDTKEDIGGVDPQDGTS